jgi:hypothetical protein
MADGEVSLLTRVARVDLRQALGNGEAVKKEVPRSSKIALLDQDLAHLVVGDEEIALSGRYY